MTKTAIQMTEPESSELSDTITFVEEEETRAAAAAGPDNQRWKILVVDDDQDVHDVTRFVLGSCKLVGRPVELIEARSLKEAQDELLRHDYIAVILLDVVMEEHDSGLKFVRWVREAGLHDVRIILRTGQPGYAPELDVIRDYDINDYRSKAELTQTRLITSVTTALRSFEQLQTSERISRGLETIIASCSELFQQQDIGCFAQRALLQAASLCNSPGAGLVAAVTVGEGRKEGKVISGMKAAAAYVGLRLVDLPASDPLKAAALNAIAGNAAAEGGPLALCIDTPSGQRFVICLGCEHPLDTVDAAILRLFAANLAVGFENQHRVKQLGGELGR